MKSTIETYEENPSIKSATLNTKKGCKLIFGHNNEQEIMVKNSETDEYETAIIDFTTKKIIDRSQFIKVYINAFPVLSDLKNSTKIVYQYILLSVSKQVGKDIYHFSFRDYLQQCESNISLVQVSEKTYYNAVKELLEKKILFKCTSPSLFFLNIDYVFNGDRLRFITEYHARKTKDSERDELEPIG